MAGPLNLWERSYLVLEGHRGYAVPDLLLSARFVPKLEWGRDGELFRPERKVFLEVGGFDESFRRPAGEDVDLGLMIKEAGYEINGSPEALVYHSKKTWIPLPSDGKTAEFLRNGGTAI